MEPRTQAIDTTTWSATLRAIGRVHSPFVEALGTPVQNYAAQSHAGGLTNLDGTQPHAVTDVRGGRGTLEVFPEWTDALQDMEGCPRIWILFWVHRAAPTRTKVRPYRDTTERGLFSTRAPARPNPIGISCVKLLGVSDRFVHVAELDALDGSPLLDIKPYVDGYDCFPGIAPAWLGSGSVRHGAMVADGRFEDAGR